MEAKEGLTTCTILSMIHLISMCMWAMSDMPTCGDRFGDAPWAIPGGSFRVAPTLYGVLLGLLHETSSIPYVLYGVVGTKISY